MCWVSSWLSLQAFVLQAHFRVLERYSNLLGPLFPVLMNFSSFLSSVTFPAISFSNFWYNSSLIASSNLKDFVTVCTLQVSFDLRTLALVVIACALSQNLRTATVWSKVLSARGQLPCFNIMQTTIFICEFVNCRYFYSSIIYYNVL